MVTNSTRRQKGPARSDQKEAEDLDVMVRNLLAITRIDAGALELRRDWIDLREVAERVASDARRHGARQQIEINLPNDLPLVRADATLAEQAIGNVVANAVMHTPRDARSDRCQHRAGYHCAAHYGRWTRHPSGRICRVSSKNSSRAQSPDLSRRMAIRAPVSALRSPKASWRLTAAQSQAKARCKDGRGARFVMAFPRESGPAVSGKICVLVIDDEAAILRFLKPALEANNYELTSAATVSEGIKRIAAETPDVVLLDLGLPDGDGKDVIRRAREWSDLPIIVLSARDREAEKIEALDLGADDYVNKPFNVGELLARMRTALRHRMQRKAEIPVLRVGDLEVDAVRHRATRAGADLRLTPKEFELLSFLARHAGRVVTHKQILAAVWGPAHVEDTQYLRVYVGQLRQKVEEHPNDPRIILTEPGIGYRIAES